MTVTFLVVALVSTSRAGAVHQTRAADVPNASSLEAAIDRLAQEEIAAKRTVGLTIAIDKGGKKLFAMGYGFADLENHVPATADTVYRIASNTKQFTAAAIVQLQAAGKLRLQDDVNSLLREYPAPPKPITVRHLLQHTSGIPDYRRDRLEDVTHAEVIAEFDKLPLEFDPGTGWQYSNSNYYLLGMIIERASGDSYSNFLAKHIFEPAGMTNTRVDSHRPIIPHRASGYLSVNQNFVNARWVSLSQFFANASLLSTAPDLIAWQRALVEHRLDPPDMFERMTTDLAHTGLPDKKRYGYGLEEVVRPEGLTFGHGGSIFGFVSVLIYFPRTDHTLVILSNTQGYGPGLGVLMDKIRQAMFAEQ